MESSTLMGNFNEKNDGKAENFSIILKNMKICAICAEGNCPHEVVLPHEMGFAPLSARSMDSVKSCKFKLDSS